jgi:GT2 family glycosyltransferase
MDLSIIIVSYNNSALLQQTLQSVYENTNLDISYEIIVVDNNSQDDTLQMLTENFPKVKVVDNEKNYGFAAGNNIGLNIALGKAILFLNNDTFILNNALNKMYRFLFQNKDMGALTPQLLEKDGHTIQHQGRYRKKIWENKQPQNIKFASGTALMVKKMVLDRIGGFDEAFFFYNEDIDLCHRISERGYQIFYYPEAQIIHYGGKTSEKVSSLAKAEGLRGGIYYVWKYYRWLLPFYLILMLIGLLLAIIISLFQLMFSSHTKKPLAMIQAYLQVYKFIFTGKYRGRVEYGL